MAKTVLVTGASSGIGEATVRRLLGEGWRVFAAARRLEKMAPLGEAGARLLPIDLSDDASMVAAVATIRAEAGGLDALVNNAGYGSYGSLEEVPLDEGRRQFEVNVFGLARLTQLVLPMMREARSGTILNVSSIGGKMYEPFGAWYHATKFAVEGMSDCLRLELEPFGIRVVIVEPGPIQSEWSGIAHDNLLRYSGSGPYAPWAKSHAAMLGGADQSSLGSPPDVVAKVIVKALAAARPKTRYPAGGHAGAILFLRWLLPDRGVDWIMRRVSQRAMREEAAGGDAKP